MKLLNNRETLRYTHESRVILLLVFTKLSTIALCRATSPYLVFIFRFAQSRETRWEDVEKSGTHITYGCRNCEPFRKLPHILLSGLLGFLEVKKFHLGHFSTALST